VASEYYLLACSILDISIKRRNIVPITYHNNRKFFNNINYKISIYFVYDTTLNIVLVFDGKSG